MEYGPLEHILGYREDLTYRDDLSDAIAVFVRRPDSDKLTSKFIQYLKDTTDEMGSRHPGVPPLGRSVAVHPYEIPPAAGTWSEIAVLLWENSKLAFEAAATITGAAQGIRWLVDRGKEWRWRQHQEAVERLRTLDVPIAPREVDTEHLYFLSQGALCVLVVADRVERFGSQEDLRLNAFPRGIQGYNDPVIPMAVSFTLSSADSRIDCLSI